MPLEVLPGMSSGGDDLAVQLRELAFGLLLARRQPVVPGQLAALVGAGPEQVESTLERLANDGLIDRDSAGRIVGSAGLTLASGPHRLQINGQAYRTWCAFDALGIPAAVGADATVTTACSVCDRPIRLELRDGHPDTGRAERLWLAAGGADLRADFCTPTVLLCSDEHAAIWADRQAGRGAVLSLVEAVEQGAHNWRSAATAFETVRARAPRGEDSEPPS